MKIKRPQRLTRTRIAFENRQKNIVFHQAVRNAQARANLKMERDRLHGMLHTNINPGLKARVWESRNEISGILGD